MPSTTSSFETSLLWGYAVLVFSLLTLAKGLHKFSSLSDTRIVGGVETTIAEVPYMVYMRLDGRFICGGSLVTAQCVLTAAHCVKGVPPAALTIHAGSNKLSQPGTVAQVEQHYVSPLYSTVTLDMDIAIVKLDRALSGPNIATINLCTSSPESNNFVQITGWGITSEIGDMPPDQVRTTSVRVVPKSDCMQAYAGKALLTSTMFCATIPGQRDSCSGDSGGPVAYNGKVCGIVSWGLGCARPEYPGVYTNVASKRVNAFVKQTLRQHCF